MADGINITVTTEDTALRTFIDLLNNGLLTTKEYTAGVRELNGQFAVGSKEQMQLKAVQDQVAQSTKLVTGRTNDLVAAAKEGRQEHRLGMFVMMEAIRTIDAFSGKNKELTQTLSGAAEAYFGVSFAVKAMGGSVAALAGPIGIASGALVLLKSISDQIGESLRASTEHLKKLNQELGIETPTQTLKALNAELVKLREEAKTAGAPSAWQWVQVLLSGQGAGVARQAVEKTNVNEAQAKVLEAQEKIYAAQDKDIAQKRAQVSAGQATWVQLRGMIESYKVLAETDERRLNLRMQFDEVQKQIDQQEADRKAKAAPVGVDYSMHPNAEDFTKGLKAQEDYQKHLAEIDGIARERLRKNHEQYEKDEKAGIEQALADAQYSFHEGTIDAEQYKQKLLELAQAFQELGDEKNYQRMLRLAQELKKYGTFAEQADLKIHQLIRDSNLATAAIDAIQGVSQSFGQSLRDLAQGTINIGDAFVSFQHMAIQAIENVIQKLIEAQIEAGILQAIMAIFSGGSSLAINAGAGAPTASNPFPGGAPEPIDFSGANQILQKSGGGGSHFSFQPSVSVHPIINNQGLAVQVEIGRQQRSGRVG